MSYSLLIVDPSTTVRAVLKRTIRQTEFGRGRLYEADCTAEAMDVLEQHRVDLVLIDPRLTDADGVEWIGRILAEPETRGVPVIVMANRLEPAKLEQLRRLGVRGWLRKPFTAASFREAVAEVLEPTHV